MSVLWKIRRNCRSPNTWMSHNRAGQYIHWKICQHYNAPYAKNWYEHKPEKVVETESA